MQVSVSAMDVSVVIPVYQSQATLAPLVERLTAVLDARGLRYEIIFVEDGSRDDSWNALRKLQSAHPDRIIAIQLMRNFGQHNAIMCGLRRARGDVIVTMDDDLQHPPEELPKLLDALNANDWDLVYGCYHEKQHAFRRNLGSALVFSFYKIVFRSTVRISSFRAFRRQLAQSILAYDLNYTFIDGLLAWSTQRIGGVPVEHHPRMEGRSTYTLGKLLTLALNLFTNFSILPLQVISILGFIAAACGILTALYYLVMYFLSQIVVPGYASIIVAILTLGGVQLLALGMIGEYLGRLHLNMNRKPQYVERQVLGPANEPVALPPPRP